MEETGGFELPNKGFAGGWSLEVTDLLLRHPGVGNGKQQSLLDSGPDLIDIDTAGDIVIGGLPPDL